MTERLPANLYGEANEVLRRMTHGGVLCTVVDGQGNANVLTLGWGADRPGLSRTPHLHHCHHASAPFLEHDRGGARICAGHPR